MTKTRNKNDKNKTVEDEIEDVILEDINVRKKNKNVNTLIEQIEILADTIKKMREEINNLKTENSRIMQAVTELQNTACVNDDLLALKSFCIERIDEMDNTTTNPINKVNAVIPKFKGTDFERPKRFLVELESYVKLVNPRKNELECILTQALEEEAKTWLYTQLEFINDFENFKKLFEERYWNNAIKRISKRKLEFGKFHSNGKMSRVNYATNLISLAKELEDERPAREIILQICEHFEKEIRYAIFSVNNINIKDFINILSDYDNDDKMQKRNVNFQKNDKNDITQINLIKQKTSTPKTQEKNTNKIEYDRIETIAEIHNTKN